MPALISLIVPCYNEEKALPSFWAETKAVTDRMDADFEFIFVDDGSQDGTLRILRELAASDSRVKYISFSRNFGKESAMYAGFEHARGDYAAVMDADLQDPPSLLPELLRAVTQEGYDPGASPARGSLPSVPSSPGCSTGSSTGCPTWTSWTGPGISG